MLFHFFNTKTQISDNYLLDPVSNLKLYPKQSNSAKATLTTSGAKLPKAIADNIRKIYILFHHKLADVVSGYLCAGENVSSPYATSGIYLSSGKLQYQFSWHGSLAAAAINTSALTDDSVYLLTATISTNISFKMNKLSIVNNALVVGSDINSTSVAVGTDSLTGDFGILAGAYSSGSLANGSKHKVFYMRFEDVNSDCIASFNFSEGAGNKITDVCSGNQYEILNETDFATFWSKKQDFWHYNFRYGFTLYQKSGSPDLRIPNKVDGTEIVPSSIPSGYTRIANYKECKKQFNQCESLFCLDSVSAGESILQGYFDPAFWDVTMPKNIDFQQDGTLNGKPKFVSAGGDLIQWEDYGGFAWCVRSHLYLPGVQCYSYDDVTTPDLATTWTGRGGTDYINLTLATSGASDLYTADPDFVLFTESTGVAKNIDVSDIYSNVVDLVKDRGHLYINQDSDKNMMLYKTDKWVDTPEDLKIWKYVK